MTPPNSLLKDDKPRTWAGLRWRIAAAAGLGLVSVLSTIRFASASFDEGSVPVADANSQDGVFNGTVRIMGDHVALYSGTSLESISKSISVNFSRGGSLVLCPHSQLQILKAGDDSGMLLAFQAGGSAEPFPLRTGDEVITPDWRVDFNNDLRKGDIGTVQISTNRRGELCLEGNAQSDAYFRVSQMTGNASFQVAGQKTARFSNGKMVEGSGDCACDVAPAPGQSAAAVMASSAAPPLHESSDASPRSDSGLPVAATPASNQAYAAPEAVEVAPAEKHRKKRQHPQDVAGYVRSFVHLIFGR